MATPRSVAGEEVAPPSAAADFDLTRVFLSEYPRIARHILFMTGDRALAEDIAQESFGRLMQYAAEGGTLENPGGWLRKVATNLAINDVRGSTRRAERERKAADAPALRLVADDTSRVRPLPDPVGPDLDAILDVRAILQRIEPRERAVLLLRHSGFAYAEIAESIGVRPSSVGTLIARAQRRFRELYEDAAPSAGPASSRMPLVPDRTHSNSEGSDRHVSR